MPVLGLVTVGIVASGLLDAFPAFLRFVAVLAVFSYLPGEAVLRRLMPHSPGAPETRLPLAFFLGLSLFAVASWIFAVIGVPFRVYVSLLEAVAAVVLGAALWPRRAGGGGGPNRPPGASRARTTALIIVAVAVSCYFIAYPPAIDLRGDSLDHLSYVNRIISQDRLQPTEVLAPPVFADDDAPRSDPRKGMMHPLMAAISNLSSMDPVEMWRMLPAALAPFAVLAFAAFAGALLPSGGMVAGALVLFLLFQGGIGRQFFGVIAYGQHLSLAFFWLLVVVAMGAAPVAGIGTLLSTGLLCLGGALIHVDVAVHAGLMYAGMLLFHSKLGFSKRGILRVGAAVSVGVAVAAAWKLATSAPPNVMHTHPQGLLYFGDIGSSFYAVSPIEIIRRYGLVFFAGLFWVPVLPVIIRNPRWARSGWIALALSLPPIAVAFNPLVAPLVYEKGSYLLHRFVLNVPSFSITALVLGAVVLWGRRGRFWGKTAAVLVLIAWARPFSISMNAWWLDAKASRSGGYASASATETKDALADVIRLLNENIPAGSVVASDPLTSYVLGAFTNARVVAVLHQHGNPGDPYPLERLEAAHAILSPFTGQNRTVYAIRRFGVEYVVVNGAFRSPYHDYLAHWDPAFKQVLEEKFESLSGVFRTIHKTESIAMYRVMGTEFERIAWDPVIPFTGPVETALDACEGVAAGNVRVVSVGTDPRVALPGERIGVAAAYRRLPGQTPPLPLLLRIRVEDRDYFEEAARYPGDKYVRRFLERRRGELRRFRIDRTPFAGYFRPEEWPEDRTLYDAFDARLPLGLAEADYRIEAELMEETLLPNFTIGDFLFNEDSYRGEACTNIEVRRHVVR